MGRTPLPAQARAPGPIEAKTGCRCPAPRVPELDLDPICHTPGHRPSCLRRLCAGLGGASTRGCRPGPSPGGQSTSPGPGPPDGHGPSIFSSKVTHRGGRGAGEHVGRMRSEDTGTPAHSPREPCRPPESATLLSVPSGCGLGCRGHSDHVWRPLRGGPRPSGSPATSALRCGRTPLLLPEDTPWTAGPRTEDHWTAATMLSLCAPVPRARPTPARSSRGPGPVLRSACGTQPPSSPRKEQLVPGKAVATTQSPVPLCTAGSPCQGTEHHPTELCPQEAQEEWTAGQNHPTGLATGSRGPRWVGEREPPRAAQVPAPGVRCPSAWDPLPEGLA